MKVILSDVTTTPKRAREIASRAAARENGHNKVVTGATREPPLLAEPQFNEVI